jgi:hypothetical protein
VRPLVKFVRIFLVALAYSSTAVASTTPEERVFVCGDRLAPIELAYSSDLTVAKAIIAAGGYGDFSGSKIYLVRAAQVTTLDIRAVVESGKDVPLQPWDIIVIGKTLRPRPR